MDDRKLSVFEGKVVYAKGESLSSSMRGIVHNGSLYSIKSRWDDENRVFNVKMEKVEPWRIAHIGEVVGDEIEDIVAGRFRGKWDKRIEEYETTVRLDSA